MLIITPCNKSVKWYFRQNRTRTCGFSAGFFAASPLSTLTKAKFSWTAVKGAEKYQIYYSTNGGKYKKLATVSGSKTSATLSGLDFKKNDYKFKIRSYDKADGKTYYSSFSKVVAVK